MRFITSQFRNLDSREGRFIYMEQDASDRAEGVEDQTLTDKKKRVKDILDGPITSIGRLDVDFLNNNLTLVREGDNEQKFRNIVTRLTKQADRNWARLLLRAIDGKSGLKNLITESSIQEKVKAILDRQENEKTIDRVNKILENPLHFSLAGVRFLEKVLAEDEGKNPEVRIFTEEHRMRFINLIVYSYESNKAAITLSKVVPPRILLEVSTLKRLWKILPLPLQGNINDVMKQNVSEVEKVATTKPPTTWTKIEVSKVCSIYLLLREQGFAGERIEKISKGLTEWIAHVYKRAEQSGRIDWDSVSSTEKLLILEVRKLLGDSTFFGGGLMRDGFEQLAQGVAKDLVSQDSNNPDLLLVWDLIEDIPNARNLSGVDYQKLQQLIEYGNASRFLQTVEQRGHRVLSLIEFQALEEVNTAIWEAPEFWDDSSDRMKRRRPIDEKIIKLEAEIKKLSLDDESSLNAEIEHMRDGDPLKDDYKEKGEKRDQSFNALEEVFLDLEEHFLCDDELVPLFEDYFADFRRAKEKDGDKEARQELLLSFIESFRAALNQERQRVNRNGSPGLDERKKGVIALNKAFQDFGKTSGTFKKAKEYLKKKASEQNKKKIDELNGKITTLKDQYDDDTEEERVIYGLLQYFEPENQKNVAQEVKTKYFVDLEARVQEHRLHADDLDVLWDRQVADSFMPKEAQSRSIQIIGLRDRFADVLLEGTDEEAAYINSFAFTREALGDPEAMVREVELFFGGEELLKRFKKAVDMDYNWDELVKNPQIKQEIIRGVMQHFRGKIYNVLGDKLPADFPGVERDKFWNVMRRHFAVRQPDGVKNVHQQYEAYENNQQQTNRSLEETRQKYEQMSHGYTEKGKKVSEDNFDFWSQDVGGFDKAIDDLSLQTSVQQDRVKSLVAHFLGRLAGIKDKVKIGEDPGIEAFVEDWQGAEKELCAQVQSIGQIAQELGIGINNNGENQFVKEFLEKGVQGEILSSVSRLVQYLGEQKNRLSADDVVWSNLSGEFERLREHLDFKSASGKLRVISRERHNEMRRQPENIKILNDLGLFEEDGEQKALEKFDKMRVEYDAAFVEFERNAKDITRKVRLDIHRMSDEDFVGKYGSSKETMEEEMQKYDASCTQFNNVWKDFRKPEFFENWLEKYKGNDPSISDDMDPRDKFRISRANAIDEFSDWDDITKQVGEMGEFAQGYRKWLDSYSKWKKDNSLWGGMKRVQWQSFSIRSVYEIVKQFMEVVERRRKRREDKTIGNLGVMIFGNTIMGKEFDRMASKAEDERISEWKAAYGDEEPWNLRDILYKSKEPDEVKALIDLIIEKGFFRWDDPQLLLLFNRLQKNVTFLVPEDLNLEYSELKKKIYSACRGIWPGNSDRFRAWDSSFEDSLKKAQGVHTKEFDDLEHNKSERKKVLANMLQAWGRGEVENIDPAKYEAYLYRAFETGKLNGQPDPRWFFLIMGLTLKNPKTNQTLLSRRVLDRFQALMTQIPPMEFFIDTSSPKKDGKIVPKDTPGSSVRPWGISDFEIWKSMLLSNVGDGDYNFDTNQTIKRNTTKFFYQNMIMSGQARGRFDRVQISGKGKIDHDDGAMFAAMWDFETMKKQITEGMDTTGKFTPDFWRNVLSGYDLYFRQMNEYIREKDQEWKDNPAWPAQKEQILKDIGNRLKAAFMLTQAMSGNYRQQSAKMTLVFDQAKWDENNVYSICARHSKEKIEFFMDDVLDKVGESQYKSVFDIYAGGRESDPLFKKTNDSNEKLFGKDEQIFQNTSMIEQALEDYVTGTGGFEKYFTGEGADYHERFQGKRKTASSAWGGLESYADMKKYQAANDEEDSALDQAA